MIGGRIEVVIRPAERSDIGAIIALFAEDALGGHGDTTDEHARPRYEAAFARISASPNDMLYVAERKGEVVATFQTTLVTTLRGQGSSSLTISAVQTRADLRGRQIGEQMMRFAIEEARAKGARTVQLMSNSRRTEAHRFYERLGFSRSHAGFKIKLE
ncbi:MAG: GNAT family N-acetyltransferase [Rhizobiales bacterium 65-79]|jgi:GNAT superfamily N-acetyltransferase|nr:GNAT family N-acetyltransferase [Hyphomicrobiales bacterium]OJU05103.1 MAG: GNAT family N-acetyltransferase [Rhizobiales bacterium 65-79]